VNLKPVKIGAKKIGPRQPAFIVAEISANHGQDLQRAISLIREAKKAGADAVKFQAYTPDTLTINSDSRYFRVKHHKWGGQTLYQLYKKAYTPWEWFGKLKKAADDENVAFFVTAFDRSAVDFLEELKMPVHKISSFELVDLPLIKYAAETKKPLIISTGMGSLNEIAQAVDTARKAGCRDLILLKCTSSYPAEPEEMNLRAIPDMAKRFRLPVGLSDHTLGIEAAITGVSLGAVMIEKHFTLSRKMKTPDNFFSLEPQELKGLVKNIRFTQKALGEADYNLTPRELESSIFRRSIFAVRDIKKDGIFTEDNIRSIRPSNGLAPKYIKDIFGKRAKKSIKKGTPLKWDLIGGAK